MSPQHITVSSFCNRHSKVQSDGWYFGYYLCSPFPSYFYFLPVYLFNIMLRVDGRCSKIIQVTLTSNNWSNVKLVKNFPFIKALLQLFSKFVALPKVRRKHHDFFRSDVVFFNQLHNEIILPRKVNCANKKKALSQRSNTNAVVSFAFTAFKML